MTIVISDGRLLVIHVLNYRKNVAKCVAVSKKNPNFAAVF